jgi:hypothetical protein
MSDDVDSSPTASSGGQNKADGLQDNVSTSLSGGAKGVSTKTRFNWKHRYLMSHSPITDPNGTVRTSYAKATLS